MSRPQVSFVLFAYNQEQYIEDAVRGALAQDYEPSQIILSDDNSTDRTFAIMESVAKAYAGPHTVLLNRNQKNLGVASHVNRLLELATGEIIVVAAGDDVSMPERTSKLVSQFTENPRVKAALSGHIIMNSESKEVGRVVLPSDFGPFTRLPAIARSGGWVGMGATWAYLRECFVAPRKIPDAILCEDRILPFRAGLRGAIGYVSEPLVQYRIHDSSATALGKFHSKEYEAIHQQALVEELDWAFDQGRLTKQTYQQTKKALLAYPSHFARSARLAGVPIVGRFYNAIYHRATMFERIKFRLRRT